jgi:hypothetical protein
VGFKMVFYHDFDLGTVNTGEFPVLKCLWSLFRGKIKVGYVTCTGETRNTYRILARYLEGISFCVSWT